MHVQIIIFYIVRILSKNWTNTPFVLQVDAKIMPVIVMGTIKVQAMGIKGRGRVQEIVFPLLSQHTTLVISEKQSKIPTMIMWYLPIVGGLRHFFSNPKNAELKRWWDSYMRKMGDGKL